jgi:hypothetical protein
LKVVEISPAVTGTRPSWLSGIGGGRGKVSLHAENHVKYAAKGSPTKNHPILWRADEINGNRVCGDFQKALQDGTEANELVAFPGSESHGQVCDRAVSSYRISIGEVDLDISTFCKTDSVSYLPNQIRVGHLD